MPGPLIRHALLALPFAARLAAAQGPAPRPPAEREPYSLDLAIRHVGISIGNSRELTGIRLNWRDEDVTRVSGINVTLWSPGANPRASISGLAVGVIAPGAARLSGLMLGVGGIRADERLTGIGLGGFAVLSHGTVGGLTASGLAVVADSGITGFAGAGLAVMSRGAVNGIGIAGASVLAAGGLRGISVGGLASVIQRRMSGVALGGLAVVTEGPAAGILASGLGVAARGDLSGVSAGGLVTFASGRMRGVNVGGLAVVGDGGVSGIMPGAHAYVTLDLAPGEYGLICFVPDAKDGKGHYRHGLAKKITVAAAS